MSLQNAGAECITGFKRGTKARAKRHFRVNIQMSAWRSSMLK
jgi:hypothetical protein